MMDDKPQITMMMLNLPDDFVQTIRGVFGEDGRIFLESLPDLVEEASSRWGLTDVQPVSNLSYNFVSFAKCDPAGLDTPFGLLDQRDVVLKIGVPNRELTSEMNALKLFNGNGACQLLDCDEERGFLLLERLKPGKMLSELEDDDERTYIAADVMQRLWRDVQKNSTQGGVLTAGDGGGSNQFIQLLDWFDGLKKIRPHFNVGTGPFPKELLEQVESFLPELFADKNVKLMHGDFHHFNILSSERGWLVIDPKGVIGPVGDEVGPLMLNPWNSFSDRTNFQIKTKRRVSILAERLGWEREKIIKWSTAHAVLSAWWSIEDNEDWEYSMQCAEIFSEIERI